MIDGKYRTIVILILIKNKALTKFIWMLLQTWPGNQSGILWHGIQMNRKRNWNFEDTFFGASHSILFCPGPMHVPFGNKYQLKINPVKNTLT